MDKQRVSPGQIRILTNVTSYKETSEGNELERGICVPLRRAGILVERNHADLFADAVVITTPHSFKGYDAEIVFVVDAQRFSAVSEGPLSKLLYVAMTRARSVLEVFCVRANKGAPQSAVLDALRTAYQAAGEPLTEQEVDAPRDARDDIADIIGSEHARWLGQLANSERLQYGPLLASTGEVLASPLFWFDRNGKRHACFGTERVPAVTARRLEDEGVQIIAPGTGV